MNRLALQLLQASKLAWESENLVHTDPLLPSTCRHIPVVLDRPASCGVARLTREFPSKEGAIAGAHQTRAHGAHVAC